MPGKILFLLLLLGLGCGLLPAQQISLDSLERAVRSLPDDTTKISRWLDLGEAREKEDLRAATDHYRQGYDLAKRLGDRAWTTRLAYAMVRSYANQGLMDSSVYFNRIASEGYAAMGDTVHLAHTYNRFLYLYKRMGEYELATDYAFKALGIFEKKGDREGVAEMYGKIGSLFLWLEELDRAENYARQSYDLAKELEAPRLVSYAASLLGEIYVLQEKYEEGLVMVDESMLLSREHDNELVLGTKLVSRGNVYLNLANREAALGDFSEALAIGRRINAVSLVATSLNNIGNIHNQLGHHRQAIAHYREALPLLLDQGQLNPAVEVRGNLAMAYAGLGRYDSAYHFLQQRYALSDSLSNVETEARIAELQTQYETEQKEATIARQELDLQAERTRLWVIGGFLLLALIIGAVLFQLTRKLRQRNREKEFLIKEIHHRVKNNLQVLSSLLYLQSRHIHDEAALDAVREGQSRVEAMGLIHQKLYMGDDMAAVAMRDYLPELGDTLLDTFRTDEKRVQIVYHVDPLWLDVDTAIPLGLIVNELLTNSLKYAFPDGRSGRIEVSLHKQGQDRLVLRVADDGAGSKKQLPNGTGFGSNLVEILSKKLKGEVRTDEGPGYGTTIEFREFREARAANGLSTAGQPTLPAR